MGESLDGMGQFVSSVKAYRLDIVLMGAFRSKEDAIHFAEKQGVLLLTNCGIWLIFLSGWDYYV